MTRYLPAWIAAGLVMLLASDEARGIPAFARKYETSCHTCHTAYPKLNPFGNAFRMRGYRMPGETEDMVKEEPVSLGQDAYKRVWPQAIWPSDIPGTVPLSVDVRLSNVTEHDAATDDTRSNDFRFPEAVELLAAGTFGDRVSFFAATEFEVEDEHGETTVDIGIGHAELHFNGPWNTGSAFNVKVGRFSPELTQQFNHGYLLTDSMPAAMFGFNPAGFHGSSEVITAGGHHGGGGAISLPAGVDGLEVYGIVDHRFEYSAGVANGIGPGDGFRDGNESKDLFARLGYKIGGLALDGEGANYQAEKNWRERSVRVGIFAYDGDGEDVLFQGTGHHASNFVQDKDFQRVGVDVNAYVGDVNLIFGYVDGEDTLTEFVLPGDEHGEQGDEHADEHAEPGGLVFDEEGDFDYDGWFAEADVVFYPWLHGAARYEQLDVSRPGREDFEQLVLNFTALIRANAKFVLEYQDILGGDRKDDYRLTALLRFAL